MINYQTSTIEDLKKIADNYQSIVQLYSYGLFAKAITSVIEENEMKVEQTRNEVEATIAQLNEATQSIIDASLTNFLDQFQEKIIDELDNFVEEVIERNFSDQ